MRRHYYMSGSHWTTLTTPRQAAKPKILIGLPSSHVIRGVIPGVCFSKQADVDPGSLEYNTHAARTSLNDDNCRSLN